MKIIIGADLVPTKSNIKIFESGMSEKLVSRGLLERLNKMDVRIFNLETPLTDELSPIEKCGPCLSASTRCVKGIKSLGADIVTIANNHIMDHGAKGLFSTVQALDSVGIEYIGIGENIENVKKFHVIESDGLRIGIYACAEHEFSIATEKLPGANPFDPLETPDHIAELKSRCDYVIVLYHGGKEYYRYPSPNLRKTFRKLIDKGADLVIAQHTHCVGCREEYHNGTAVYGQGNFLFNDGDNEFLNSGILIDVDIDKSGSAVEYIPICRDGAAVRLAEDNEYEEIIGGFCKRSEEIKKAGFVEEKYKEFALSKRKTYINRLCGVSPLFKIADKLCGHKLQRRIDKTQRLAIRNYIECEAHRELILEGME